MVIKVKVWIKFIYVLSGFYRQYTKNYWLILDGEWGLAVNVIFEICSIVDIEILMSVFNK